MHVLKTGPFGEIDEFTREMVGGLLQSVLSGKSDQELADTLQQAKAVIDGILNTPFDGVIIDGEAKRYEFGRPEDQS